MEIGYSVELTYRDGSKRLIGFQSKKSAEDNKDYLMNDWANVPEAAKQFAPVGYAVVKVTEAEWERRKDEV